MNDLQNPQKSALSRQGRHFLIDISGRLPTTGAQVLFWFISLTAFGMDLLTKWAVFERLKYRSAVPIVGGVIRFVAVHNEGAAFGLFAGHPNWLIAVSFFALAAILCVFFFGGSKEKIMHVALAFFAAGICGNLYDRLFNNGLVRDFIDVGLSDNLRWPAFNLADSFLCVAVGLMIMAAYVTRKPCRKHAQQRK